MNSERNLRDVALLFLRLGLTAFGGPAAHTAMMQNEIVEKRKWMTVQHFLDLAGATNLIPGPNSTELAIHIGKERAGWKGMIIAGLCFILPAVIFTACLAWLYKEYGQLPEVQPFIYGVKPAIIAVILAAVFPLAMTSLKSAWLGMTGVLILILSLLGFNEILLMFGAGFFAMGLTWFKDRRTLNGFFPLALLQAPEAAVLNPSYFSLFLIFLKIGSVLYGSGYVLFAFLDAELVTTGLITRQVLIDAIAAGQFTPGPVFSSVTFIGYQIGGWAGAIVSTIGIFLPSFVFVALLNPIVKRMRNSELFSAFLDAVNIASVAIIVAVCYTMGRESISDWRTILITTASIAVIYRFRRINTAWIILGGAAAGYLLSLV